jgi:hypothetical protein
MANETLTLTIDGTSTSTSVTINDTSQTPVVGEQIFTTVSTGTSNSDLQYWTIPAGVTSINIDAVGGGGGGGSGRYSSGSGGGGGGGGYVRVTGLTVTPGEQLVFLIGSGGLGGTVSTNSPFETVNGSSQKYIQSGTQTPGQAGGATQIWYTGDPAWNSSYSSLATNDEIILCGATGATSTGSNGSTGGTAAVDEGLCTYVADNAVNWTTIAGKNGEDDTGGSFGAVSAGGGGGAGYGGIGGKGRGQFHRSSGGYNYYKASEGGDGGGTYLYGGIVSGSNGVDAPQLGTGPYNYTSATAGGNGGTATGTAYGAGGGGGCGNQIRNQTIIRSGYNYVYRWFLADNGRNGTQGAIRVSYGS